MSPNLYHILIFNKTKNYTTKNLVDILKIFLWQTNIIQILYILCHLQYHWKYHYISHFVKNSLLNYIFIFILPGPDNGYRVWNGGVSVKLKYNTEHHICFYTCNFVVRTYIKYIYCIIKTHITQLINQSNN